MRRERDSLAFELHWSAESNATAIEVIGALPVFEDGCDLPQHPFRAAFAIGGAGCALQHASAFEDRHAEFGPADINSQRNHWGTAANTSAGVATPVPCLMIVTDATKFPNCAASVADPVIASAMAAPAEKLSPAPQMSTGFSTNRAGTNVSDPSSTTTTPRSALVTNMIRAP